MGGIAQNIGVINFVEEDSLFPTWAASLVQTAPDFVEGIRPMEPQRGYIGHQITPTYRFIAHSWAVWIRASMLSVRWDNITVECYRVDADGSMLWVLVVPAMPWILTACTATMDDQLRIWNPSHGPYTRVPPATHVCRAGTNFLAAPAAVWGPQGGFITLAITPLAHVDPDRNRRIHADVRTTLQHMLSDFWQVVDGSFVDLSLDFRTSEPRGAFPTRLSWVLRAMPAWFARCTGGSPKPDLHTIADAIRARIHDEVYMPGGSWRLRTDKAFTSLQLAAIARLAVLDSERMESPIYQGA